MQLFADGPRRGLRSRLYTARRAARAHRTYCAICTRRRACAQIDAEGEWYCLAGCWPYALGLHHGQHAAARLVRQLVNRELDRVFDPLVLELVGWPWYRCDGCGDLAPEFTTRGQLLELGWQELGRDAHLCPRCYTVRCTPEIPARSRENETRHLTYPAGGVESRVDAVDASPAHNTDALRMVSASPA